MSQTSVTTHPQLVELAQQLNELTGRVERLSEGLHSHQLNVRPEEGRWSIAECVVHLNLFTERLLPVIREACAAARNKGWRSNGAMRMDSVGRLLKFSLEPPYRVRVSTSAQFEPTVVEPVEEVIPRFLTLQRELIKSIERASGLDLNRIKITSPVSRRLRYNLFSCFSVIAAHQRRHLWQAEQVKEIILTNHY